MARTIPPSIQVSPERHTQIKAIAAALGNASMSETIGHLVRLASDQGLIASELPGIRVNRLSDGIAIAFDGNGPTGFSFDGAAVLANGMNEIIEGNASVGTLIDLDHDFKLEKKGRGFKVTIPHNGEITKSFSYDVGRDFVAMISAALNAS